MDSTKLDLHEQVCQDYIQYPQNTRPLTNQVAGHSFDKGCFTIGMLIDDDGYILKPVNKPEQGKKEIVFYETVTNSMHKELLQLKQFIPEFFGISTLKINNITTQFLKLSDATKGFIKPCVMDVKIGKQTWEPGAPTSKQKNEEAKYYLCKQQCGFCIPGFQVYNISNGSVEKFGKDYGKKLTKEKIPEVLKTFLNSKNGKSRLVGEKMLQQLITILEWWKTQLAFHIYSSSVLLTYDAELLRNCGDSISTQNLSKNNINQSIRVLLIDFAHVIPANNVLDYNYLNGLENFVHIFKSVLNEL